MVYSYFEKGCRKNCTRQSRKALWVVLSSLFFKEIWKNWYKRPWKCVCQCLRKATKVGSTGAVVRNIVLIISHIAFRVCRVHIFPTTFLEIAVYGYIFYGLTHMQMSKNVNNNVTMNPPIKRAPQRPYKKGEIWVFNS